MSRMRCRCRYFSGEEATLWFGPFTHGRYGYKIRERTVFGIDLLTLGLFESAMKRWHTGRR